MPTSTHWPLVKDLLNSSGTEGNLTTDAHIAALAVEHGYTVYSNDANFGRFPSVKWVNPLIQRSILLNENCQTAERTAPLPC